MDVVCPDTQRAPIGPASAEAPKASTLRQVAEAIVAKLASTKSSDEPKPIDENPPDASRQVLHELLVHQVELEMQNEELRRTQADLEISRGRYFDLYDQAPVGYVTFSEKGQVLEANLAAANLFGTTRGSLIGLPFINSIHQDDVEKFYLMIRHNRTKASEPLEHELRMVKRDGTPFWAHLRASGAQDGADGSLAHLVITDITGRKAAEARVARLSMLYAALSECGDDILHCRSADELLPKICRNIVERGGMKVALVAMLKGAGEQVGIAAAYGAGIECLSGIQISLDAGHPMSCGPLGTSIREGRPAWCHDIHSDPLAARWHGRAELMGLKSSAAIPLYLRGKAAGALSIYTDSSSAFEEDFRNLLVRIADNTSFALDHYAEEDERRKAEDELRQKTAEMERFTYTVSHDLKSPLVTINTFIGYLEKDLRAQNMDSVDKDLAYVHGAAEKMGSLLNELLQLARLGSTKIPPTEATLQEIAHEALNLVAGQIAARGVRVEVTEDPIWLFGDRRRLVEVFQNLLDNAVKFLGDQAHPWIEIGAEEAGDELVFFVRDNGQGIDPRHQAKLFGLFEKLDPQTPGAGMGLAMAQRIVEMHGGKIWAQSDGLGQGTTFRFTLAQASLRQATAIAA